LQRLSHVSLCAAAALVAASLFAAVAVAQSPQPGPPPGGGAPRSFPAPTNLKVLPKDLTGQQVRDIMEVWEGSLGGHCNTCHAADPKNIGPNGRPRLNFADDSKPEKTTARMMFTMMEDINKNYVGKLDSAPRVTCGTCHRGHLDPEPFVIPPDDGPPRPPAGTPPPPSK
jgi:photosynthetic reaction center cytochrome c subunit